MSKKLIIAFDVGTTFSGVSYAFQDADGQQPEIHGVTRFPGFMGADSKIPSQVMYRQTPTVAPYRFASEVDEFEQDPSDEADEIREDCIKVQWFKILLRPGRLSPPGEVKTQLPVEVSAIQVFADYLQYLHRCAMDFIKETHVNSAQLLQAIGQNIHYIVTHPNGWDGPQQARIRTAAAKAGLVKQPNDTHLHLLTEGEASINFCVEQGLTRDLINKTEGIAVIDAGGGTIDISAYRSYSTSNSPGKKMKLEEITDARCLLQGSIFVTWNAEKYLRGKLLFLLVAAQNCTYQPAEKLKNSAFKGEIENIAREFDRMAKLRFRSPDTSSFIKFGKIGENEPATGIRNGQIGIPGKDMASFFQPSIDAIVETFNDIKDSNRTGTKIKRALLVGGFAASQYLSSQLKERLALLGIELFRPDRHLNKAVANGAVAHFLNRSVVARVVKYTLGTYCCVRYDPNNPEHRRRAHKAYIDPEEGYTRLSGLFEPIVAKGMSVKEDGQLTDYTKIFSHSARDGKFRPVISSEIVEYRGHLPGTSLQWVDLEPHQYETLCDVRCFLSEKTLRELMTLPQLPGVGGIKYARLRSDISLILGGPEMSAHAVLRYQPKTVARPIEIKSEPAIVYFDRDED